MSLHLSGRIRTCIPDGMTAGNPTSGALIFVADEAGSTFKRVAG